MKKILTIVGVLAAAAFAHGQGYIIVSSTAAAVSTNTSSLYSQGSGTFVSGNTATTSLGFYYALLFSQASLSGSVTPTNSGWTLATQFNASALGINNSTITKGGLTGTGGTGGVQVNMAAGTTYNVQLVGWSASLGTTYASVLAQLQSGDWVNPAGYFGYTAASTMTPFATAGAGDPTLFPATWANGSLVLYSVAPVPEPSTLVLAGLGGLSLLAFRRKK